jgi:hypothetical protein
VKRFISLAIGIFVLAVGSLVAFPAVDSASAAPAGAATGLKATALSCTGNLAKYRLSWTPSGKGAQRVDLSATNNGFANNFSSANLGVQASTVDMTSLKPGTTYYVRIVTLTSGGALASDTLSFKAACQTSPAFSVPSQLKSTQIGKGTIRFQWTAGQGNQYFCLDTASNLTDLVNFTGSWRNHGCGTTTPSVDVSNLSCGTVVYWRVFAWGTASGHSEVSVASTPSCFIGQPSNLNAQPSGTSGVLLSWTPGADNVWFCVDVAKSPTDLANLTGSWRNYGCWMTGNSIQLANLDCGATYYWNVYAWNASTNTRSANASFEVLNCNTQVKAPIEQVDVEKVGSRHFATIVAGLPDACHSPASHQVERNGNLFIITVLNDVKPGQCASVYGTYDLSVNLGTLEAGKSYTVVVNGEKSKSFVAN